MVRFLRHQGYEVKYVRNITDIDDKIIKRSQEEGIPAAGGGRQVRRRIPARHGAT